MPVFMYHDIYTSVYIAVSVLMYAVYILILVYVPRDKNISINSIYNHISWMYVCTYVSIDIIYTYIHI
jgi:hypothetical protein